MTVDASERLWKPLSARERRVLGVLVEKQKTTPEYYPMSIAAIVTGCNQKSNRDPITNFDADDVEEILQGLRKLGAAVMIEGGGRVVKWKHSLYEWFGLRNKPVEMAVLAELMLRGRQTEGDLRARASRMEEIPDLESLQLVLKNLVDLGLAVYLTPPGVKRGAVLTHNLYPPAEMEHVRQEFSRQAPVVDDEPRVSRTSVATPDTSWKAEFATLKAEFDALRAEVAAMADELRDLKSSLGA
jgi:hypothetical protein